MVTDFQVAVPFGVVTVRLILALLGTVFDRQLTETGDALERHGCAIEVLAETFERPTGSRVRRDLRDRQHRRRDREAAGITPDRQGSDVVHVRLRSRWVRLFVTTAIA
jgi:hypothetical protein